MTVDWQMHYSKVCFVLVFLSPCLGFCKLDGFQCCDFSVLELKEQMTDRNKFEFSNVEQSEWPPAVTR